MWLRCFCHRLSSARQLGKDEARMGGSNSHAPPFKAWFSVPHARGTSSVRTRQPPGRWHLAPRLASSFRPKGEEMSLRSKERRVLSVINLY